MATSRYRAVLLCFVLLSGACAAGQVRSSMRNVDAYGEFGGFFIQPVRNIGVQQHVGDESPPQVYEIIRPDNQRISLGRLFTSCTCVELEAPKTTFEQGERAFVTLRNVKPTPPGGQNYAFFVQLVSPVRTTLRQDTFVQSDRFRSPHRLAGMQYSNVF